MGDRLRELLVEGASIAHRALAEHGEIIWQLVGETGDEGVRERIVIIAPDMDHAHRREFYAYLRLKLLAAGCERYLVVSEAWRVAYDPGFQAVPHGDFSEHPDRVEVVHLVACDRARRLCESMLLLRGDSGAYIGLGESLLSEAPSGPLASLLATGARSPATVAGAKAIVELLEQER